MGYSSEYLYAQMSNGAYDSPARHVNSWSVVQSQDDHRTGFAATARRKMYRLKCFP